LKSYRKAETVSNASLVLLIKYLKQIYSIVSYTEHVGLEPPTSTFPPYSLTGRRC